MTEDEQLALDIANLKIRNSSKSTLSTKKMLGRNSKLNLSMALPEISGGASLVNVEKLSFRDILNPVKDDQEGGATSVPSTSNYNTRKSNISLFTRDVNDNYLN